MEEGKIPLFVRAQQEKDIYNKINLKQQLEKE